MKQRSIIGRTQPGAWSGTRWDWTSIVWYKNDKNFLLEAHRPNGDWKRGPQYRNQELQEKFAKIEDEHAGHWTYWRNGDQYVVTHDGVIVETNGKRLGHGTTYTHGLYQACVCAALDAAYGEEFTGYAHNYRLHRDCATESDD